MKRSSLKSSKRLSVRTWRRFDEKFKASDQEQPADEESPADSDGPLPDSYWDLGGPAAAAPLPASNRGWLPPGSPLPGYAPPAGGAQPVSPQPGLQQPASQQTGLRQPDYQQAERPAVRPWSNNYPAATR